MSNYRCTEHDIYRVSKLVDHLLSKPAVKYMSLITAERIVTDLLKLGSAELRQKLGSEKLFPHIPYDRVVELISSELFDRVKSTALPVLYRYIESADLTFLDRYTSNGIVEDEFRRLKFHEFTGMMFGNRNARFSLNSAVNIIQHNAAVRYIADIYRSGLLDRRLEQEFEKLPDLDDYISYISLISIARGIVHLSFKLNPVDPDTELCIDDIPKRRKNISLYTDRLAALVKNTLPGIPENLIKQAIKSNFPSPLTGESDLSSRLVFILSGRFQSCSYNDKPSSAAVSPDSSWFALALKNAEFFGYDPDILEVLYSVAAENNW